MCYATLSERQMLMCYTTLPERRNYSSVDLDIPLSPDGSRY